jgi:hypothetical protein
MSVFGKAKFGGNKRTWFKLKDGDSTFRILPPMGELMESGRWSVYAKVHYGYKNSEGKTRTFESPEVRNPKTRMIDVADPALDRINQLKAKLEEAKLAKNEELVKQLLNLVGGKKSRYNLDNNHYLNVVDLQGNIGILKIRHRAKLALDAQIEKLRNNGVEPLGEDSGRFFTFSRSGTAMDTVYQVSVYKKKITIEGVGEVEQDVVHKLTDEIANRCCVEKGVDAKGRPIYDYREAAPLHRLFKKPTAAEVARMVKEGEKAVDEILDSKFDANVSEDDSGLEGEDDPVRSAQVANVPSPEASALLKSAEASKAAPAVVAQAPDLGDTHKVKEAPVPVPTASVPPTTAQTVETKSDDDFLKELGL